MYMNKKLKRIALEGLLCLNFLGVSSLSFANDIQIGRYLSVVDMPKIEQQKLLQQQIQVQFPSHIKTIGQAIQFILRLSGYHLADYKSMSIITRAMLIQQLPEVDRNFGPMTLRDALTTLAGDPFCLLVDPVHRLISYKIKPQYQTLFDRSSIE